MAYHTEKKKKSLVFILFRPVSKFLNAPHAWITHVHVNINIGSLWKNRFVHIAKKIKIQRKATFLQISLKKLFFTHMSKNINISSKMTLFWEHIKNFVFLSLYSKISTFQENGRFFRPLLKIGFCPYIRKYPHFEKTNFFRWKHFGERHVCFEIILEKSFLSINP